MCQGHTYISAGNPHHDDSHPRTGSYSSDVELQLGLCISGKRESHQTPCSVSLSLRQHLSVNPHHLPQGAPTIFFFTLLACVYLLLETHLRSVRNSDPSRTGSQWVEHMPAHNTFEAKTNREGNNENSQKKICTSS